MLVRARRTAKGLTVEFRCVGQGQVTENDLVHPGVTALQQLHGEILLTGDRTHRVRLLRRGHVGLGDGRALGLRSHGRAR